MALSAWVEILPDFSKLDDNVKSHLNTTLSSAGSSSASAFGGSFGSGVGQIFAGSFLADIAGTFARGVGNLIGTGIRAGIEYGLEGVSLASDLEQSSAAIEAVFKDQADAVLGFARDAATAVGLSQSKYQTFATVVGAQLKNLGVPVEEVSTKTNDLIVLGADLAAQFGGPTSDAVGALSSLLRGERDPIERYGVSLKQVDIDARKAVLGLEGLTGEQDRQADIQATLSLLYDQTADAQGTFFEKQDTYAGKLQILNAELENSKTALGEVLLPAFTEIVGYANESLLPKLNDVIGVVGPAFQTALADAAPKVQELFDKVAPLVEEFAMWAGEEGVPGVIDGLGEFVDAVPDWIDGFNQVDGAVRDLDKQFRDVQDGLMESRQDRIDWFASWVEDVNTWAGPVNDAVNNFLFGTGEASADGFNSGIRAKDAEVEQSGKDLGGKAQSGAQSMYPSFYDAGGYAAGGLAQGIRDNAGLASDAAAYLAQVTKDNLRLALRISSPSKVFYEYGAFTSEGFALGIKSKSRVVTDAMRSMVSVPSSPNVLGTGSSTGVVASGGSLTIGTLVAADPNDAVRKIARNQRHVNAAAGISRVGI